VVFEPRPAFEAAFAGDCQLCIAEFQGCTEDLSVGIATETRMEFSYALGGCKIAAGVEFEEVSRLMFEMV
jgi:hypothetical protein